MQYFSLLLAWRYVRAGAYEHSLGPMIGVCIAGSALGALALTLVACIMQGFEQATHRTLQSINPSIIIRSNGQTLQYEKINTVLKNEFPEISAAAPTNTHYVLIKEQEESNALGTVLLIKGIDPTKETAVTALHHALKLSPEKTLASSLNGNQLIIGKKLAEQQGLTFGDTITLLAITNKKGQPAVAQINATIGGMLATGVEEVDQTMALANLTFVEELFPESGITEIGIAVPASVNTPDLVKRLQKRFSLEVLSWHELYPALVSALKLEKYVAFLVIALISLVASMNIISLLFMYITHKRRDIALVAAYGLNKKSIRTIFLLIGTLIGIIGASCGALFAFLIGIILRWCPFIQLPDIYYTQTLPIDLDPQIFIFVFIVTVFISIMASLIPLRQIKHINCADVLRFEG